MIEYEKKGKRHTKSRLAAKKSRELTKQKGVPFGIIRTLIMIKKSFEN